MIKVMVCFVFEQTGLRMKAFQAQHKISQEKIIVQCGISR